MPNIKKNFIYSSILTSANYIFPFLTYPYVSRVLGVNNIGICNFVDGIINYFILFSMMGISIVGVREIAKVKDDPTQLNKTFSSLFFLNTISTSILLIILLISTNTIDELYKYKELIYVGAAKLVCNYLLIEWLYTGLENFKYITIRTILVKSCYVIGVFLFVKDENDYPIYYILLVLMVVVNSIFNIIYARKFVRFKLSLCNIKPFAIPFLILGIYALLTSMYTSFNVTYLGFVSGTTEVGYYTTATKIYSILLALFTAFTNVMLPRMSALLSENKTDEFKNMINKSCDVLLTFCIPTMIIGIIFAPEIILIISGEGYEGAITPMRIIMPLMLIIGYAQIVIVQILMPLRKDKAIFINSICGAGIGIILNILLVPSLNSIGSSIVWTISELTVLICGQYFVYKYTKILIPLKKTLYNLLLSLPIAIIIMAKQLQNLDHLILFIASSIIILLYCFFTQIYILKNKTISNLTEQLFITLKLKHK